MKLSIIIFLISVLVVGGQAKEKQGLLNQPELTFQELRKNFKSPTIQYRPETWFHLNGNNISKEGLTLDLEAIKEAGLQGIHLFNKSGQPYPNVNQIKILSPEWEAMIRHAADECKRLGLKFTMQNCPGWSMTGGPWVPAAEAQREIVESVYRLTGGSTFNEILKLDSLYKMPDYDYKEVQVLAFPTPEGDDLEPQNPSNIETNNALVPWSDMFNPSSEIIVDAKTTKLAKPLEAFRAKGISKVNNKDTWVKTKFDTPVTIRSIVLPPLRHIIMDSQYPQVDVDIKVEAILNNKLTEITIIKIPDGNWNDRQKYLSLAIPETTSSEFVFTFLGVHSIVPEFIHLTSKPRLHNHEAKAAKTMRRLEKRCSTCLFE